jgi:hypothetical protein
VVHGAHLFVLSVDAQSGLEPVAAAVVAAVVKNGTKFSQCNMAWEGFPWAVTILATSSQNYPSVAPTFQGSFGVMELGFLFLYPSHHLGSPHSFIIQ